MAVTTTWTPEYPRIESRPGVNFHPQYQLPILDRKPVIDIREMKHRYRLMPSTKHPPQGTPVTCLGGAIIHYVLTRAELMTSYYDAFFPAERMIYHFFAACLRFDDSMATAAARQIVFLNDGDRIEEAWDFLEGLLRDHYFLSPDRWPMVSRQPISWDGHLWKSWSGPEIYRMAPFTRGFQDRFAAPSYPFPPSIIPKHKWLHWDEPPQLSEAVYWLPPKKEEIPAQSEIDKAAKALVEQAEEEPVLA